MTCSVPGCTRTDVNKTQGLCHAHDQRRRRGKPLDGPILDRRRVSWPECQVGGCSRNTESKTGKGSRFCPVHQGQVRSGVAPGIYRVQGLYKTCLVPGCEDPFRSNKLCNRHSTRMRMYSLTPERFVEIITSPCSICGGDDRIHVDHDHACCSGEKSCGDCVRGALCSSCNLGLGAFKDDPGSLMAAIEYLSRNGIE